VDVTIRGRIFALTYDRLMAKTEAAGPAAHRVLTPHALVHVGLLGSGAQNVNDVRQFWT
jgi:hypothetical protein